jgi:type I restriction enzyme S subunit
MRVEDTGEEYRVNRAKPSVPAGYRRTDVGVIPEGWDVQPLSQFCTFSNGVNADKRAYGTGIPFVNVLEAITYSHLRSRHIQGKVELPEHLIELFLVRRGDVVFNRTSEVPEEVGLAATYCDEDRVVFGGFVIRARLSGNVLNLNYAGYGLRAPAVRTQIVAKAQGAVRANIGQKSLGSVLVPLPGDTEQRAIAEALSDVDGLLEALDRLITKKRAIKQAAMQQLLTGKTRLPGFTGTWEPKALRELGSFLKGSGVKRSEAAGGSSPCVRYGEIYTVHNDYIRVFESWISPRVAASATPLQKGDVLFAASGETKAEIGKCAAFIDDREAYAGGDIVILRPIRSDSLFLGYALNIAAVALQKSSFGQGDAVVHISSRNLGLVSLDLPKIDEQVAIASVLRDMDSEIAILEQRRDKTRELKQGMMQQLLTGRTRLIQPDAPAAI